MHCMTAVSLEMSDEPIIKHTNPSYIMTPHKGGIINAKTTNKSVQIVNNQIFIFKEGNVLL